MIEISQRICQIFSPVEDEIISMEVDKLVPVGMPVPYRIEFVPPVQLEAKKVYELTEGVRIEEVPRSWELVGISCCGRFRCWKTEREKLSLEED